MDERVYIEYLGKLVANMQSLEFVLRACLCKDEIIKGISKQVPVLFNLVKGEIVSNNALTNFDTLRVLIQKYNKLPISKGMKIDENLIDIRDAIAHGRVFSGSPDGNNRLLIFNKPTKNGVEVAFSVEMTQDWIGTQVHRFLEAVKMVDAVQKMQDSEKVNN